MASTTPRLTAEVFVSLIEIRLQYLVLGAQRKKTLALSEDEYFDPEYKLAGKDKIASVPLYQDAGKYIRGDDRISATTLTLTDRRYRQRRVVSTSYWNNGQSDFTEVRQLEDGTQLGHPIPVTD